ncbi:MAG: radical SAM protein [Clostridia bacterium]|nr:radical SAM protein [Clostridia bacterium]
MNHTLRIYMVVPCSEVLGPYKRFIVWVQGCNRRCKGCIARDSWELDGGELLKIDDLVQQILHQDNIEGITVSGGEPFLHQEALCELISKVRKHKDLGVIIYTGMNYEEIKDTDLAKMADIIIDGEYIEELNDDKSLRGSCNQNVICVSDRYCDVIDSLYGHNGRKVEFIPNDGRFDMIGIPSKSVTDTFIK